MSAPAKQSIPHATWTTVPGTGYEIRQDSGSSILVEVDEAGKITVYADGPVELRAFGSSGSVLRPDPEARVRELKGRRVRLALTDGRTREGVVIGAGPSGLQLTSGIGGRMLFYYGEVDAIDPIDDLGTLERSVCTCPDIDVSLPAEKPGTQTVKGFPDARCGLHGRSVTS